MRSLCRLVPCVLFPLAIAGCFDNHGRGDAEDAGLDARGPGPEPDGGEPLPIDAAIPGSDAGTCRLLTHDRATSACLRPDGTGVVPPGESYELPIRLEGCFCTHQLRCEARIAGPHVLELTTSVCDEGALCDGCVDGIETTCTLPALEEGEWRVSVNGSDAFGLPVEVPVPGFLPVDLCWDFAEPAGDGLICPWPGGPFSAAGTMDAACHAREASPTERVEVRIVDGCASCFQQWGQCRTEITGSTVRVSPAELACDCPPCGGCADVCVREERTCHLPPLPPGDYEVFVDGTSGSTPLHVGASAPTPGEVCAPGR